MDISVGKWDIHDCVIKYNIICGMYFVSQSFGKGAGHNNICSNIFTSPEYIERHSYQNAQT